jgi:hypothetical protein
MTTPQAGDFVRYRRIDPMASFEVDHRGGVWINDYGLVLSTRQHRPPRPDKDYLVKVYFPTHPTSPIRTLRASKIDEVL